LKGQREFEDIIPIYQQISNLMVEEIQKNHKPGDLLPSEVALAKRYRVNRHTLRRAMEVLVTKGIVGKLQGKGTIVQQKSINYSIHRGTRFTETLENCGRQAESIVLRKIGIPSPKETAERLEIEEGEPIILVETLRKMDGVPFSLVSHHLPLNKVYAVMSEYEAGSLHDFLYTHYKMKLKRTVSLISAILPEKNDIDRLDISGNSPLLLVKSVNVDQATNIPIELSTSRFKGISTQLSVNLT
jgi:GntR family phosphonate transport system transcriptional regulator